MNIFGYVFFIGIIIMIMIHNWEVQETLIRIHAHQHEIMEKLGLEFEPLDKRY